MPNPGTVLGGGGSQYLLGPRWAHLVPDLLGSPFRAFTSVRIHSLGTHVSGEQARRASQSHGCLVRSTQGPVFCPPMGLGLPHVGSYTQALPSAFHWGSGHLMRIPTPRLYLLPSIGAQATLCRPQNPDCQTSAPPHWCLLGAWLHTRGRVSNLSGLTLLPGFGMPHTAVCSDSSAICQGYQTQATMCGSQGLGAPCTAMYTGCPGT